MAKLIETLWNDVGGVDMAIEKDSGNIVRILTGKKEASLETWTRLRGIADEVVGMLTDAEGGD